MSTTNPNLPEALDHPLYELEMMVATAALLPRTQGATANALFESFIVHVRALHEFFFTPKGHGKKAADDMRASDFHAGFTPAHAQTTEGMIIRMHKEVAHITYSRKRPGERRDWDIPETMKPVATVAVQFLREVVAEKNLIEYGRNAARVEKLIRELESATRPESTGVNVAIPGITAPVQVFSTDTGDNEAGEGRDMTL